MDTVDLNDSRRDKISPQEVASALASFNAGEVVPKVKAGTTGGAASVILGAIIVGFTSGDWVSGLVTAAAMSLPVVIQFATAYIKVDDRMELARRVLEEYQRNR